MGDAYPFADGDRLEDRNTYFYVPFGGEDFLAALREQRNAALTTLPEPAETEKISGHAVPEPGPVNTADLLGALEGALAAGRAENPIVQVWLKKLVKKFEVTKRIHASYDTCFRAVDKKDFGDLGLYVRLAGVFEAAFRQTRNLVFLNALLKGLDSLCSVKDRLTSQQQATLAHLIGREESHVAALRGGLSQQ